MLYTVTGGAATAKATLYHFTSPDGIAVLLYALAYACKAEAVKQACLTASASLPQKQEFLLVIC